MNHDETCQRFGARIDDLLADPASRIDPAERRQLAELRRHLEGCARCAETWRAARESERAIAAWIAPEPPPGFGARVVNRVLTEARPDHANCLQFADELAALLENDLADDRATILGAHAAVCAPCGHRLQIARAADDLLPIWRTPDLSPGFADRVLVAAHEAGHSAAHPTPTGADRGGIRDVIHAVPSRPAPRVRRAPRRALLAYAAAAGLLLSIGVQMATTPGSDKIDGTKSAATSDSTTTPGMMGHALEQIERERELRVRQVSYEQFPSEIGGFDHQPAVLDRARRPTGNAFHDAVRRAAARARSPGIDAGGIGQRPANGR